MESDTGIFVPVLILCLAGALGLAIAFALEWTDRKMGGCPCCRGRGSE